MWRVAGELRLGWILARISPRPVSSLSSPPALVVCRPSASCSGTTARSQHSSKDKVSIQVSKRIHRKNHKVDQHFRSICSWARSSHAQTSGDRAHGIEPAYQPCATASQRHQSLSHLAAAAPLQPHRSTTDTAAGESLLVRAMMVFQCSACSDASHMPMVCTPCVDWFNRSTVATVSATLTPDLSSVSPAPSRVMHSRKKSQIICK